jgi:hypothetical protein
MLAALAGHGGARAQEEETHVPSPAPVGETAWALPGLARVGVAARRPVGVTLAGDVGYGWAEPRTGDGGHHRISGSLAAAVRPLPWLAVALRLDGRYDRHPRDDHGTDDSLVGDPRMALRVGGEVAEGLMAGGEVTLWVPGRRAPSLALDATTVDVTGLLAYRLPGIPLTVAGRAGVRIDQSANAVDDADRYRQGDRLSLGVAESHAVLLGGGASYRLGDVELVGEVTWDARVGRRAPPLGRSPLRVTGVVRYHLSRATQVEVLAEGLATPAPATGFGAPLVPLEPRFRTSVGLRHRFGASPTPETAPKPTAPPTPPEPPDPAPEVDDTQATGSEEAPTAAPAPPPSELRGLVRSFDGSPLQATVEVQPGGEEATTDADGVFDLELAPGRYRVRIRADGYQAQERTVTVEQQGVTVLNVELRPARR